MKVWILAGAFTVATIPFAAASETTIDCQLDDTRRSAEQRVPPPPAPGPTVARPTVAQRDADADQAQRAAVDRRRGGKRIPDAELIGPRGAL